MTAELAALKSRLKTTWSAGDYGRVAWDLQDSALQFMSRIPIEPGTRLLDLACGTGQIALPAARAGAHATGIDIASNLIAQARALAAAEGLDVTFDEGDVEKLPYDDASFDLIFSLIGAMFAPCPQVVTAEMLRVCRPGGRIVMGNWTAEGFIGHMFRTVAKRVAPPPLMPSPLLWGNEETVRRRLSDGIGDLQLTRRIYPFYYAATPDQVVDY
ncbi:MAG: class I SAM-dependent methyltransferase, partial [Pseudomonadota bacterium]